MEQDGVVHLADELLLPGKEAGYKLELPLQAGGWPALRLRLLSPKKVLEGDAQEIGNSRK